MDQNVNLISESLSKDTILSKYKNVFSGLGTMGQEFNLTLQENATPVIHPPRRVPLAIKSKLKEALEDMVKQDIIAPIETPTDWVSSLVVVEKKNGKLRICIDPKDLNRSIKRSHYPMPTFE